MSEHGHIYGEIHNKTLRRNPQQDRNEAGVWSIRRDVDGAKSRPALTELYKRAGYLITLTHAPSWEQKFGNDAVTLRRVGEGEFRKTAHKINRRAIKLGTDADYDEKWGSGR
jgi:hypothetical protein